MKNLKLYKNIVIVYIARNYILLLFITSSYEYKDINDIHIS